MDQPLPPQLKRLIQQRLETLQRAGVRLVLEERMAAPIPEATFSKDYHEEAADLDFRRQPVLSCDQRIQLLERTGREVAGCTRCRELAETRTQTVFGTGSPQARLVFLGEAPGADEDRQGEPFVGRAGQLLTKILEACTLTRNDVYILNILKCRPPGNRNPAPEEAANCQPFLLRQLRILQPEFICCLGAVAAHNLLNTQTPIGQLRGQFHDFHGIRVLATYHPAYLLRNPGAKRETWEDMKLLMREMGIKLKKVERS